MEILKGIDKEILYTNGIKNFFLRIRKEETLHWIDDVYSSLPELFTKWGITSLVPNQISRYGLVLEASQVQGEGIILKFTPSFVNRFEREAEAYRVLPKSFMCELLDVDYKHRCLVLRKISKKAYASFDDKQKLRTFYKSVVDDAVKFTGQKLEYIGYYRQELKKRLDDTSTLRFCDAKIKETLKLAWNLYMSTFEDGPLYILHGDLLDLNILDDGNRYYGVDPIGFLAPIELECIRFMRNEIRNHPEDGYRNRFDQLVDFFSEFFDKDRLIRMFVIDMAYCTYNSVFENDTSDETKVDLELINMIPEVVNER